MYHNLTINIYQNSIQELISFITTNNFSKIAVIVDQNTQLHCYSFLVNRLPEHTTIVISAGEEYKNLDTCNQIWQHLTDEAFDRKSLVINLGGGVIGDMGGFCAATYKRGISFIQIPTTLLSMVDASAGGKLGIDFQGYKNHIGVFQLPSYICIYPIFLQTLAKRELRSGFAEVIKHCLIADAQMWDDIKKFDPKDLVNKDFNWDFIIQHSIQIKSKIVETDPTEMGLRKILNFGHTLGHAVESYFLPIPAQKLLHGEAIAIGMICESFLSFKQNYISSEDLANITQFIIKIYGKPLISAAEIDKIIPLTLQDKKNSHGSVKFSLLKSVGNCGFDINITADEMYESLVYYSQL
jgi:3-dehydroquinate synthase